MDVSIYDDSTWREGSIVFMADENRAIAEKHVLADAKVGVDAGTEVAAQADLDAEIDVGAEAEVGADASIRTAFKPKDTGRPAVILYRPSPDPKFVVAAMMTPFLPRDQQVTYAPWQAVNESQQHFLIPVEPSEKNPCCPIALTLRPGINENLTCVRADEISAVPARLFEWYRDDGHHGQRYNLATESKNALLDYIRSNDELRRGFQTAKDRVHTLGRAIQAAASSDDCAILSDEEVGEGSFEIVRDDAPSMELPGSNCSTGSNMPISDEATDQEGEGIDNRDFQADARVGSDDEQTSKISDSVVQVIPDNEENNDEMRDRGQENDCDSPESQTLSEAQSGAGDDGADATGAADEPDLAGTEISTEPNENAERPGAAELQTSDGTNTHLPGQVESQLQEASDSPLPDTEDAEDFHPELEFFEHVVPDEIQDHTFRWKLVAVLFMLLGIGFAAEQLDFWVGQYLTSWLLRTAFRISLTVGQIKLIIVLLYRGIFRQTIYD